MSAESEIKEARTIEAMKKGYMGLEGKFCNIAKILGQPILRQGSTMFDQTYLDDPYEVEDEFFIQTLDENDNSYEIGVQFDGLSRGINMTISVQHHLREIVCRFQGKIVYKEVSGELECFVPNDEWEDKIISLSETSAKIDRKNRPLEKQRLKRETEKKRSEILDYLRNKWGL